MTTSFMSLWAPAAASCLVMASCAPSPRSVATTVEPASAVATATPVKHPSGQLTTAITHLNEAMEIAFRRGDMPAVAAFYADDAVMLAPGGDRYAGRVQIDEYWSKITEPVDWQLEVLSVEGNESLAVQRGRSTLVYRTHGKEHRSIVEFILVWSRRGEAWKIVVDAYWT